MVSSSVVVFDVRPGNPMGIQDWNDLAPAASRSSRPTRRRAVAHAGTSCRLWGSALRGYAPASRRTTRPARRTLLQGVLGNVITLDKSARDSIQNFESGNGDVADHLRERGEDRAGGRPARRGRVPAVVGPDPEPGRDRGQERRRRTASATWREAFVDFLHTQEVKDIYTTPASSAPPTASAAQKGDPANGFPRDQGPVDGRRLRRLGLP